MKLQLYFEDTMGQKHIFVRELDESMVFDELDELLNTFNMLLTSCGYDVILSNETEESED